MLNAQNFERERERERSGANEILTGLLTEVLHRDTGLFVEL